MGDRSVYRDFFARSSNWATLFDAATGWIAPRDADGAFMHTPITENGQSGFQEGNAAQYTWMVPQDLRDLIAAWAARARRRELDTFFTQLDAGQDSVRVARKRAQHRHPVGLSLGRRALAHASVLRQALLTLYSDTPVGFPGTTISAR